MRKAMIAIAICFMLVLAACNSSGKTSKESPATSNQADDKQIELNWYLISQSEEYNRLIEEDTIAAFEREHPNIKVKLTYMQDPEGIALQQMVAGAGPDILVTGGPSGVKKIADEYLLPLDEYAKLYGWEERYQQWAYDSGKKNGKLYAIPGPFETLVVFYNKRIFEENGWSVPNTFEEMLALSAEIQQKGLIPFAYGNADFRDASSFWLSEAFNLNLGADGFKKVLTGEQKWNSPDMKDAMVKLNDMWQKGYINEKQSHAITLDDAAGLFFGEQAAMQMNGTWMLADFISEPPSFDWDMFVMPAWKEGVEANLPLALGSAFAINKHSKNPDAAALFIDWMDSPDIVAKAGQLGEFRPVKDFQISGVIPQIQKAFDLLNEYMEANKTGYAAWTYWPTQVSDYSAQNLDAVFLGGMSIDTYLGELEKEYAKDVAEQSVFEFN